jgi:hypothetical protein
MLLFDELLLKLLLILLSDGRIHIRRLFHDDHGGRRSLFLNYMMVSRGASA